MKFIKGLMVSTVALASSAAFAVELGNPEKGLRYASAMCTGCHAVRAGESQSPIKEAPAFALVANTPGITATALVVWLQSSHPTMPNLILQRDDMYDVVAYIESLRSK